MVHEIPILCCIDVEPDKVFIDPTKKEDWQGFEAAFHHMNKFRTDIEEQTKAPVHFTWFFRLDEQVRFTYGNFDWGVRRYETILKQLMDRGDEIGMHVHPFRWSVDLNQWVQDYGNRDWVDTCIESSAAAFQSAFGRPCRSNRMGNRWLDTRTVNLLERVGIRYDLTLEPGFASYFKHAPNEYYTGCFPDSRDTPVHAYCPDLNHYATISPSERSILLIPISTGKIATVKNPLKRRLLRILNADRCKTVNTNLNMRRNLNEFQYIANRHLKRPAPYLAMTIRTGAFMERHLVQLISGNLSYLLRHRLVSRFRFTFPESAVRIFKSNGNVKHSV